MLLFTPRLPCQKMNLEGLSTRRLVFDTNKNICGSTRGKIVKQDKYYKNQLQVGTDSDSDYEDLSEDEAVEAIVFAQVDTVDGPLDALPINTLVRYFAFYNAFKSHYPERKDLAKAAAYRQSVVPEQLYVSWLPCYQFLAYIRRMYHAIRSSVKGPKEVFIHDIADKSTRTLLSSLQMSVCCDVPQLRGATVIPNTLALRVRNSMYQSPRGTYTNEEFAKSRGVEDVSHVRSVYILLNKVERSASDTWYQVPGASSFSPMFYNQLPGTIFICPATTTLKHTSHKKGILPVYSVDFQVVLPPQYSLPLARPMARPKQSQPIVQLQHLAHWAHQQTFTSIELVARMKLYVEDVMELTIHQDVQRQLVHGTLNPVLNSRLLSKQLTVACYGGFIGREQIIDKEEKTQTRKQYHNKFVAIASLFLKQLDRKATTKKEQKKQLLMATHGAQYCLLWNHVVREDHARLYRAHIRRLLPLVQVDLTQRTSTREYYERVDLYMECLALLPAREVQQHVQEETLHALSDYIYSMIWNVPWKHHSKQLYHVYMMIQCVLLVVGNPGVCFDDDLSDGSRPPTMEWQQSSDAWHQSYCARNVYAANLCDMCFTAHTHPMHDLYLGNPVCIQDAKRPASTLDPKYIRLQHIPEGAWVALGDGSQYRRGAETDNQTIKLLSDQHEFALPPMTYVLVVNPHVAFMSVFVK